MNLYVEAPVLMDLHGAPQPSHQILDYLDPKFFMGQEDVSGNVLDLGQRSLMTVTIVNGLKARNQNFRKGIMDAMILMENGLVLHGIGVEFEGELVPVISLWSIDFSLLQDRILKWTLSPLLFLFK